MVNPTLLIFIFGLLIIAIFLIRQIFFAKQPQEKKAKVMREPQLVPTDVETVSSSAIASQRIEPVIVIPPQDEPLEEFGFTQVEVVETLAEDFSYEVEEPVIPDIENIPVMPTLTPKTFIMSLNVMAKKGQYFTGYELLQALLGADLRYGQKRIFHRHEYTKGQGKIIFSVASAVEPGTFDLTRIGQVTSKGLCLFMDCATSKDPLGDFDLMLSTAFQLQQDLDGEVFDDTFQAIHSQSAIDLKNKIQNWLTAKE